MPERSDVVIILATYNEASNVEFVYSRVRQAVPHAHVLFVDDNSPDGTGRIVDQIIEDDECVSVIHRPHKMGVGGAHRDGITWAYEHGYATAVAMDCDMLHSPDRIPDFLDVDNAAAVVVGSRFLHANSQPGWQLYRRFLGHFGHMLTQLFLGMHYDAMGSFRRYDLTTIPRKYLDLVDSNGYSFFFESLHVLHMNGFRIDQVPVVLVARTKGVSKMGFGDILTSIWVLLRQVYKVLFRKNDLLISRSNSTGIDHD